MNRVLLTIFSITIILIINSCERDLSKINKPLENNLGEIEGFTKESMTNNPISNVNIKISNSTNISVISDSLGYYSVSNLTSGKYLVCGIKDGYREDTLLIEVESNKVSDADLYLTKIDTNLTSEIYYFSVNEGYPQYDTICEPQVKLNMKTKRIFGYSHHEFKWRLFI